MLDEAGKARIVSPQDTELYDMSLFSNTRADSILKDKNNIIEDPVFKVEDLASNMIKLKIYTLEENSSQNCNSLNFRFSVLHDEIVAEISLKGVVLNICLMS